MKKNFKKIFLKLILSSLFLMLLGCGSSPKTNFYLLSAQRDVDVSVTENLSIGVWAVKLPELIDRPEIVTRTGAFTINRADFHRWASGLSSNVSSLIANELSTNFQTSHVDVSPWSSYRKFDYQVKVHIRTFLGELGKQTVLDGGYVILNGKGNKKLAEEAFSLKAKTPGNTYQDMASSMSELVVALSNKISETIALRIKQKAK